MTNYQITFEKTLTELAKKEQKPKLLLHCCCAPCSSYVLECIHEYFDITLFYYNPNISPQSEYQLRLQELNRFVGEFLPNKKIEVVDGGYYRQDFLQLSAGREHLAEGGARCYDCYALRLKKTAEYASKNAFDYFATTLSVSPHKNAEWLNKIGEELSQQYDIAFLYADFKKKNGYKRSCELASQYGLYRQNFCGCEFSKNQK